FVNSNTAATSSLGTLPSNTIANPKSDLKEITTRSGVSYDGPSIPPPVVKNEPEAIKDTVIPTNNGNTEDVQPQFVNSNTAATSSLGTLPSNTIANPKSDLKEITTRSGVSYDGPSIPPPVVKNEPEAIKDTVIPTNNGNTEDVQPQVGQSKSLVSTSEPANTPVSASMPNPQASIPYPSRRND
nr:reverse transcriptase domain-containing protein [Tanacetum cinerariifolium]